jgi:4-hydroxy 2-oxovalerate aldolase
MPLDLLDCTLRDGSYAINFSFTERDTRDITRALSSAGLKWIEVGHGLGLGASRSEKLRASATDAEYISAARDASDTAKIGAFFQPDIGSHDDIRLAVSHGLDFLRVGVNVNAWAKALPVAEWAKNSGLWVSINLMKTHTASLDEVQNAARAAADSGIDAIYVVDSTGTMTPETTTAYITACSSAAPKVRVGLHGHDNLRLANANALAAAEAGADLVDATLQGIGRDGGNLMLEAFACLAHREAGHLSINLEDVLAIGQTYIRPRLSPGVDAISVVGGATGIHSSYFPLIQEMSSNYGVTMTRLMMELQSRGEVVDISTTLVARAAEACLNQGYALKI